MDVLEAAFAIVRRLQAEERLHAAVPFPWKIGHRQIAFDQGQFQLVAQHDMEAVAQFIGLHPDQARLERIEGAPKALGLTPGIVRQAGAEARIPTAGKGLAPGHPAFPEQRLAFMHPHRGGLPQGPGEIVIAAPGQALLIEGVAPFMGRGQESGEGLPRHHPGGDAEVLGTNGAGEGVRRARTLAARRVVAPTVEEFAAELLL